MKKTFMLCLAAIATAFALNSCEDVPAPYDTPTSDETTDTSTSVEAQGDGTADNPYNVAAIIEYTSGLSSNEESDDYFYFTGIITSISEVSTSYGNATFYISDTADGSETFYCYHVKYLNNTSFTSEDAIAEGDTVTIYGKVINYYGNTPETVGGSAYIYSINGSGSSDDDDSESTASGSGTVDDPYNVAAIIEYASALASNEESDSYLYFKGIVTGTPEVSTSYGNATFYISDTGSGSETFYCYRVKYLDNTSFTSTDQLVEGDTVVIYGKVTNYYGNTPETVSGSAYVYSISSASSEGATDGSASGNGTVDNPYNVAAIVDLVSAMESNVQSSDYYYIKGIITGTPSVSTSYGNATFYISDTADGTETFYCYRVKYLDNASFTSEDQIAEGDTVVIYGKVVNYYGNTPETVSGSAYIYSISSPGSSSGSDDETTYAAGITVDGSTVTLVADGVTAGSESVTIDLSTFDFENQEDVTTVTSNGVTLTFAQNDGRNAPKYYTATNGVRMYAQNSLTITGSKTIAKVVLECDSYSGTDYVGNDTRTLTCSGDTFVLTNTYESTSGGVQMRVQTVTVTYAE